MCEYFNCRLLNTRKNKIENVPEAIVIVVGHTGSLVGTETGESDRGITSVHSVYNVY